MDFKIAILAGLKILYQKPRFLDLLWNGWTYQIITIIGFVFSIRFVWYMLEVCATNIVRVFSVSDGQRFAFINIDMIDRNRERDREREKREKERGKKYYCYR